MIKKAVIAIAVILSAAAIIFAAGSADQSDNSASNSNNVIQQKSVDTNNETKTVKTSKQTTISAAEAKKIAEKYIEEPGANAGTPSLNKQDGKLVYTVPIVYNGENAGEINIDAETGKNLGGSGGAP